jgi:hypothetical protein
VVTLRLLALFALVLLFAATAQAATSADCWDGATGAVLWWDMNADSSPSVDLCGRYNGTWGAGVTGGVASRWTNATTFDANGELSATATSPIDWKEDWMVSSWYKPAGVANTLRLPWAAQAYAFCQKDTTTLYCTVWDGAAKTVTYGTALVANNYYHIVFTYAKNSRIHLYINGTYQGNATVGTTGQSANVFSASRGDANYYAQGDVDELSVYNYTDTPTNLCGTDVLGATCSAGTMVYHLFNTNSIAAAGAITLSVTPNGAAIDEAQVFTAVPAGNASSATGWWWTFANGGTTYFTDSGSQTTTQTLNVTGNWSVTAIGTFDGANVTTTENVTVTERPAASWVVETYLPMAGAVVQFNDTSTDPGSHTITNWWWDFDDGTTSTTQNATNTFTVPGIYEVCLIVANVWEVNSTASCANTTINGFALDVLDEKTTAAVTCWELVASNTTYSANFSCRNNSFYWYNFTNFPTGDVTLSLVASGYVPRVYYAYYDVGYYVNLDAYLLDTASGIYPIFNVVDTSYKVIENALVSAYRTVGASTVLVSQRYTDSAGIVQLYLDPTATHTILTTKAGYNPDSSSVTPTATTYMIVLTTNATAYNYFSINETFFIVVQPFDAEFLLGTQNATLTIHDPYNNLNFYNFTIINASGDVCLNYYNTLSGGEIYTNNSTNFLCTVAPGTKLTGWVEFDRNSSSPYNFTVMWWTGGNYSNHSIANVFGSAVISTEFKELISVAGIILAGVAVGSPMGAGIGAIAMIATATMFTAYGWINVLWLGMAILMGLAAYVYSVRGQGAAI